MKIAPDFDSMTLFILFVVPGLISMHIYRLIFPARDIDWKNVTTEALFYSCLNFALCLPVLVPIHRGDFSSKDPFWYVILLMLVLFVFPIIWPAVLCWLLRNRKLMKKLQLPYPSAWDYFFDKREAVFVLVQLKNGKKLGGYYGVNSYATSFPREGDLYIEGVIQVNENGEFQEPVSHTAGSLIRKDEYEILEFFRIPEQSTRE